MVKKNTTVLQYMKVREFNMKGVWIAKMYSENFDWISAGNTKDEAINAIVKEWNEGIGSSRREKMSADELKEYYGIGCTFLKFGECEWH